MFMRRRFSMTLVTLTLLVGIVACGSPLRTAACGLNTYGTAIQEQLQALLALDPALVAQAGHRRTLPPPRRSTRSTRRPSTARNSTARRRTRSSATSAIFQCNWLRIGRRRRRPPTRSGDSRTRDVTNRPPSKAASRRPARPWPPSSRRQSPRLSQHRNPPWSQRKSRRRSRRRNPLRSRRRSPPNSPLPRRPRNPRPRRRLSRPQRRRLSRPQRRPWSRRRARLHRQAPQLRPRRVRRPRRAHRRWNRRPAAMGGRDRPAGRRRRGDLFLVPLEPAADRRWPGS